MGMETGPDTDGGEDLTPQEEAALRGKEHAWLTDYGYVAGEGTPYCKDNQKLLQLPWRDSSNNYDRVLAMEAQQRRYHPKLVFFAVTREPKYLTVPVMNGYRPVYVESIWLKNQEPTSEPDGDDKLGFEKAQSALRHVRARANEKGAWLDEVKDTYSAAAADQDRDGQPVMKTKTVFMGWRFNYLPVGDANIRAEDSNVYARVQKAWNTTGKLPDGTFDVIEGQIKDDLADVLINLGKLTGEDWSDPENQGRRIVMERRWILGRNHFETYQQYLRILAGKVPDELFFRCYNQLRRRQIENLALPVEQQERVKDPYEGSKKWLLDKRVGGQIVYAGSPEHKDALGRIIPEIRITLLNDHGLTTLAEYMVADEHLINGYSFERTWEWRQNMRAKALQRAKGLVDRGELDPKAVGDFVDDWPEAHTYWMTPSCSDRFIKDLATQVRTDYRKQLPDVVFTHPNAKGKEVNRRLPSLMNPDDTSFQDELNSDILATTPAAQLADKKCVNVNAFAHIVRSCRITLDGQLDWSDALEAHMTVEEDRDSQRRNEDQIQTRTLGQAYDAAQIDASRTSQARDRGIGGPRSAQTWIQDPKFRLLWCKAKKMQRGADGKILRNDLGNPLWEPRYLKRNNANGEIIWTESPAEWKKRCDETLFVAQYVQDPYYDRRPADTAIATNLVGRKASITSGVKLNISASTKGANGQGYTLDDLLKDLPGMRNYLPDDYQGDWDAEFYVLQLELMYYIDPRYVVKTHKGSWSWYLFHEQSIRTMRIDPSMVATRETFLRQQDVAWNIWRNQKPERMGLVIAEDLGTAMDNRIFNVLPILQKAAAKYPSARVPHVKIYTWDSAQQKYVFKDLEANQAFEELYRSFNWDAHGYIADREAEDTFIGYATAFTGAAFGGLVHAGLGGRLGDANWTTHIIRSQGRQSYLNQVMPKKKARAEAVECFGSNGGTNDQDWAKGQIESGGMTYEWATGKDEGDLYFGGAKILDVRIQHTAEFIQDHAYPGAQRARKLAEKIWERVEVERDGEKVKEWRWGWVDVRDEAIRLIFGLKGLPEPMTRKDKWRLDTVRRAFATNRNWPLLP